MTELNLKNYMCIDYPGYVVNAENAIKTLGGIERIEKSFQNRNGKLFLNYNPDNIFTKVLCSTKIDESITSTTTTTTTNQNKKSDDTNEQTNVNLDTTELISRSSMPGLLIKITKNKDKNDNKCIYESIVLGKIEKIYSFKKLADFQYLPMSKIGNSNNYEGFYDNFRFDQLSNDYKNDLIKSKVPLYVLPPFFSRFDDPVNYALKPEPNKKSITHELEYFNKLSTNDDNNTATNELDAIDEEKKDKNNSNSELICSVRQERSSQALLITFESPQVPSGPSEKLKKARNDVVKKCIDVIGKLFKDRPCYLKSVLLYITDFTPSLLKECLPYVAYYFTTGPWRSCWVRYGYDPRKNPSSKIYQMIDYRLRYYAEPEINLVKPKPRSAYHKRKFQSDLSETEADDYKNIKIEETMYKFKADQLPSSRNVFYQICDIEDDEVQNLIHSNDGQEKECNEKDGWCILNIQDKCRNIMSAKHEKLVKSITFNKQKLNKKD